MTQAVELEAELVGAALAHQREAEVGRFRLTVSKAILKAPMVSALEATM
jgi:hypothetical protein